MNSINFTGLYSSPPNSVGYDIGGEESMNPKLGGDALDITKPIKMDDPSWSPKSSPGFETGPFKRNQDLQKAQTIKTLGNGPEDLIQIGDFLYTATDQGIERMRFGSAKFEIFAKIPGRPIGLAADGRGGMYVVNAVVGLHHVDARGNVSEIAMQFAGKPLGFLNNIAVGKDGTVYLSQTSQKYSVQQFEDVIRFHDTSGRLLRWTAKNGVEVLAEGLSFPNGVAIEPSGRSLLVAETGTYSVKRIYLANAEAKAGTIETVLDNLPGFPDNIKEVDGLYWLGIASPRNGLLDTLLKGPRWLLTGTMKALSRVESMLPKPEKYGMAIAFNAAGKVVANLQDPTGAKFFNVTSALFVNNSPQKGVYIGTFANGNNVGFFTEKK